jgi:hypothetical protein
VTLRVRAATPDDVDGIARVHVEAWRETYRELVPAELLAGLRVEDRAAMWRRAVENPDPRFVLLVAEDGGEVVGFAAPARPATRSSPPRPRSTRSTSSTGSSAAASGGA